MLTKKMLPNKKKFAEKNFPRKKIFAKKNLYRKKILPKKKFLLKKNFCRKKLYAKKNFAIKIWRQKPRNMGAPHTTERRRRRKGKRDQGGRSNVCTLHKGWRAS